MIDGLQTGNAALVGAAAEQMHANSADVGGNNVLGERRHLQCRWFDRGRRAVDGGCPGCGCRRDAGRCCSGRRGTGGSCHSTGCVAAAPAAAATTLAAADAGTHDHASDGRGTSTNRRSPR